MSATRPYALVLYGATGFTGGLCARYLARKLPAGTPWALAGRNRAKLEQVAAGLPGDNPPELIEAVAREAQNLATPIDDIRGTASHRKAIVGVLTKRTLERAVEMARQGSMPFSLQRSLAVQAAF